MALDKSVFINHIVALPLAENERTMTYTTSSGHGGTRFEHHQVAPASKRVGGAQLMDAPMSSLVANIGMTSSRFEKPKEAITSASYNHLSGIPIDVTTPPNLDIRSNDKPAPYKGPWTEEEDIILKDLVMQLGKGKWSIIAQSLPRRIGKQCRERWINQLNPDIKQNNIWTKEEDIMLIQAHQKVGNRWSSIATSLPGWSENAIKNHWNANKRSLKAKRRFKKKNCEQVPHRQLSILEEYIHSLYIDSKSSAPLPPVQSLTYNKHMNLSVAHTSSPEVEMQLNVSNQARSSMTHKRHVETNLENPLLPDLNISYDPQETLHMGYPKVPAPQLQLVTEDPKKASFTWFLLAESLTTPNTKLIDCSSYYIGESSNNSGAKCYYNEAGPSNIGGSGGSIDLASREFLMPSIEQVSLGLSKFK